MGWRGERVFFIFIENTTRVRERAIARLAEENVILDIFIASRFSTRVFVEEKL